jgi:hypothetical protein
MSDISLLDTIQFRRQFQTIIDALEANVGNPNNLRQLLFSMASSMQRQVINYLAPMQERMAGQLKTRKRAATRLENGMELSDAQDHKAEIEDQVRDLESRLENLNNQIDECLIISEITELAHDRVVIETGKGDLFSDIRSKADAKREKAQRDAEAAALRNAKSTEASLDKATAESDTVSRADALMARIKHLKTA